MPVSDGFRSFALEQLARVAPDLRSKRMFGGVGIYSGELFFALLDDDTLYLKVDAETRGAFEARGLGAFRPGGPDGEVMQYYELPVDVLEDAEALRPWVTDAIDVAARAKGKRGARRRQGH